MMGLSRDFHVTLWELVHAWADGTQEQRMSVVPQLERLIETERDKRIAELEEQVVRQRASNDKLQRKYNSAKGSYQKRIAALEALTTTQGRGLLGHIEELERKTDDLDADNARLRALLAGLVAWADALELDEPQVHHDTVTDPAWANARAALTPADPGTEAG